MSNLNNFTNLYQLQKTLRFELKPTKETMDILEKWLNEESVITDNEYNLILKDRNIAEAYTALKPIIDKLHEHYINVSLTSDTAKKINFAQYLEAYRNRDVSSELEEKLRLSIGETFAEGESFFATKFDAFEIKPKKLCLQDKGVLLYILNTINDYVPDGYSEEEREKFIKELKKHIESFKSFYTYLSGYNENRNNYYNVEGEKTTAISTRIVHENLPKFCSNIIRFENRKDEYQSIYNWLNENERITEIKNSFKLDFEKALPIVEKYFTISHFNQCLAQSQIEEYNRIIGNFNLLINLYNQNKKNNDSSFRKLDEFTTLFKQIGCGKRARTSHEILKDKEEELSKRDKERSKSGETLTVESCLKLFANASKKYFITNNDTEITIPYLVDFLNNCQDWRGIYWSKSAVNTISNKYFSNWHSIKDNLKSKKACVTYDKNREEPIQLRDAIELSELFDVLDREQSEFLFKRWVIEKYDISTDIAPSKYLIKLICSDIITFSQQFVVESQAIIDRWIDKGCSKKENLTQDIKEWLDLALDTMRMVRFFSVRESKMKGNIANSEMEKMLSHLLHTDFIDWFGCYDLIRNYLTKKPQDEIKEKKLKLNFKTSTLLQGWSDGQEKTKAATLLKKGSDILLCILKNKKIFDTSKSNNNIYIESSDCYRLILRNLKFKTLAGKGFLGEFGMKYSDMGKTDPLKAIKCLQKIIKDRYAHKYPILKPLSETTYNDKQQFDADINNALEECYICEFTPIDWNLVHEYENNGELFIFKIHCKDYQPGVHGKKDLQTLYWEEVLRENSPHQLCAGAEIFMRSALEGKPIAHKRGEKIVNRKDKNGNTIPNKIYVELLNYYNGNGELKEEIKETVFQYIDKGLVVTKDAKFDITKDKRFFERKFIFHCPINLNYRAQDAMKAEAKIKDAINEIKDINFIGIDRGEKHLVYSCTIDKDEKILSCQHYDIINGTDYVKKLEDKAEERMRQRKNWKQLDSIKNLKDGYISHVVHNLTEGAIKDSLGNINPNAYIVLEDLNTEMKRGRQKVEKQVYQKLETALAQKLNFVVDKNAPEDTLGSARNALQLTPYVKNYHSIEGRKQFGIMLYTRANYTSVTDPATGWRQTIYIKDGNDHDIKKQILEKFSDFGFDGTDFFFKYTEAHVGKTWLLYSGKDGISLPRFRNNLKKQEDYNVWVPEAVDIVSILNQLFANFNKEESFKLQIENGAMLTQIEGDKKTAWQTLRYVIGLIQQIRNSGIKTADDNFLFSPVRNSEGIHFDTRNYSNNGALSAIVDADANGAYNIARKGLIMDAHIKYCKENESPDLFISDKEWDMWLLDRDMWQLCLPDFACKKDNKKSTKRSKKK